MASSFLFISSQLLMQTKTGSSIVISDKKCGASLLIPAIYPSACPPFDHWPPQISRLQKVYEGLQIRSDRYQHNLKGLTKPLQSLTSAFDFRLQKPPQTSDFELNRLFQPPAARIVSVNSREFLTAALK
jgi:hypothetical protein